MLQGLTVEYLFHRTTPIAKGDTVLFHAAAGGVGLIACQWARSEGHHLIGTAGSDEKCALAKDARRRPCHQLPTGGFRRQRSRTHRRRRRHVVMDVSSADTFDGSLDCLQTAGHDDLLRQRLGPGAPGEPADAGRQGLAQADAHDAFHPYRRSRALPGHGAHLFDKVTSGDLKVTIGQRYPLEQIADAHRALEARQTTGSTILTL
jgi:NADPH2:quinone reductase